MSGDPSPLRLHVPEPTGRPGQATDFSFLRPGHLRGEMHHDGRVFAAGEGDADAGKGGERPADALLRGLQHVKLQGIFIQ